MYTIEASPVFKISLDRLVHFLSIKYSTDLATKTKQTIKSTILSKLTENPKIAPISSRLIDLGIKDYRQLQIDKHNIVYYRTNNEKMKVTLLAVMDSRQSIQKLLSEVTLLV